MTWQPMESAPKDTVIWACDPSRGYESKVISHGPEWMCIDWRGFAMNIGFYPTHWMPLPEPPVKT